MPGPGDWCAWRWGSSTCLRRCSRSGCAARAVGTPPLWLEELLLSSVLFVGYPRALLAAGALRRIEPDPAEGGEPSQYEGWREWLARGEATCRVIYGPHYDRLRENIKALHPALDTWMIV